MITRAKKEISHRILDSKKHANSISARYKYKIGMIFKSEATRENAKLVDKVIYPIDVCPFCKGKATYHSRMQKHEGLCNNVWSAEVVNTLKGTVSKKFDYCLDCHREFLIEMYIFETIKESVKKNKKKGFWNRFLDVHR